MALVTVRFEDGSILETDNPQVAAWNIEEFYEGRFLSWDGPAAQPLTDAERQEFRSDFGVEYVCTHCNGLGSIPTTELHRGRRVDIRVPCWRCRSTGFVSADAA